jgi:hypothetical protein
MASRQGRAADRRAHQAAFLLGAGALLAWSVPVMVALSQSQPVRVDAVIAWLGLIGAAFLVGVAFPGSLPSPLRRENGAAAQRTRGDRRSDMVVALFLLALSVSLAAQDSWGHWYSLLQAGAALAAGFKLAAATGPTDLGRDTYGWHPEMSE